MSRIGKKPIAIPDGVTVTVAEGNNVTVKGPKGELSRVFNTNIEIKIVDNTVEFNRNSEDKFIRSLHGTTRSLINGMITGVSTGFSKKLVIVGVGYRAQLKGNILVVNAGYSHPVEVEIPKGLTVEVPSNTEIIISGIDKQLVGEFAANVRKIRRPEPYKGKGIKYDDEQIRRKEGKTAA